MVLAGAVGLREQRRPAVCGLFKSSDSGREKSGRHPERGQEIRHVQCSRTAGRLYFPRRHRRQTGVESGCLGEGRGMVMITLTAGLVSDVMGPRR